MQYTTLLVVATFIAVYVGMALGRWPGLKVAAQRFRQPSEGTSVRIDVAGSEGPTYISLEEDAPSGDVGRTSSWAGTRALNADGGVSRSRSGAGHGKARLRSRGDATGRCGEGRTGGNDRGRRIRGG